MAHVHIETATGFPCSSLVAYENEDERRGEHEGDEAHDQESRHRNAEITHHFRLPRRKVCS